MPFLLPALAAAQTTARKETLPSAAFRYEDLTARKSGTIVMRQILTGDTHSGFTLDLHETELPAGEAPHAPHHHVHEEMLLVREGLLEVTNASESARKKTSPPRSPALRRASFPAPLPATPTRSFPSGCRSRAKSSAAGRPETRGTCLR